jgi:ankyrin repeat protein
MYCQCHGVGMEQWDSFSHALPDTCLSSIPVKRRPCHRHLDCVDYLLTAGADATIVTFNVRRETALHLAAAATHSTCVARLLDASVMDPSGSSRRLANIVSVNVRLACHNVCRLRFTCTAVFTLPCMAQVSVDC